MNQQLYRAISAAHLNFLAPLASSRSSHLPSCYPHLYSLSLSRCLPLFACLACLCLPYLSLSTSVCSYLIPSSRATVVVTRCRAVPHAYPSPALPLTSVSACEIHGPVLDRSPSSCSPSLACLPLLASGESAHAMLAAPQHPPRPHPLSPAVALPPRLSARLRASPHGAVLDLWLHSIAQWPPCMTPSLLLHHCAATVP